MQKQHILVIGSGGREHAIIWALKKSPQCGTIYAAPGNAGISELAVNILLDLKDAVSIKEFCQEKNISFVFVGPEAPLVDGITDRLEAEGIRVCGPSQAASIMEGSKEFMKDFCKKYNIPTAQYHIFTQGQSEEAKNYVDGMELPVVIKADGLAAGKGVVIAHSKEEAYYTIDDMFAGRFGDAGATIVIEEFLQGEEISVFAFSDGKHALLFGSAQDHKAVGEGDTGPNTGGMGTYSPAPIMNDALEADIMRTFIQPTLEGMKAEGRTYKGVLFAGFMITDKGPKLLEYNIRFGDPETQSLMLRLESDLITLCNAIIDGTLNKCTVELSSQAALCVVMAANGYPGAYDKGSAIQKLDEANAIDNVVIFHAGTKRSDTGEFQANGGRVLGVCARGNSVAEAQKTAYQAVDIIHWPEGFCRRDIGWRAVKAG